VIADLITALGAWSWVVLGLVLIGAELLAPGIFMLWLGLAALVAGGLTGAFALSWQASTLTFVVLSVVSVLVGRYLGGSRESEGPAGDGLNRRGEALVGRVFVLDTPLKGGEGRLRVDDSSWRIIGPDTQAGTRMRVVRIDGTTLVVEPG
jgi:membrane protein implicated in regulation of membrane protease activity